VGVVIVNVVDWLPVPTVAVVGTVALVVSRLDSVTTVLAATGALKVTVPTEAVPSKTVVGKTVRLCTVITVTTAVLDEPVNVAVIVTAPGTVLVLTAVSVNMADAEPALTVTLAGTVTLLVSLLDSVTGVLTVTEALKTTVPDVVAPTPTVFGEIVRLDTVYA